MNHKLYLPLAVCAGLLGARVAQAHEFWFEPVTASLAAGDTARLDLRVGEFFEGEQMGFSAPQTAGLRQYSASGRSEEHTSELQSR